MLSQDGPQKMQRLLSTRDILKTDESSSIKKDGQWSKKEDDGSSSKKKELLRWRTPVSRNLAEQRRSRMSL